MSGTWASGWVTGDVVTAAEYGKGIGAVYNTVVTGSVAANTAATATNILMRFNNDSAANYDYQTHSASATTATAVEGLAQTALVIGQMPANNATASVFGQCSSEMAQYAGTTGQKTANSRWSHKTGTGTGNLQVAQVAGFWRSTAAISRITLLPAAGNFAIGTRATLYVMGA
jgi:hypothetical protein